MQHISTDNTTATSVSQKDTLSTLAPECPYALVVDDDEAILSVIMLLLESEDYVGLGFSDSTKVIPFLEQLAIEHLPSVVLLDLMMPLVSGYDIAIALSQQPRYASIPIIIMTADNRVKSAEAVPGASDWIGKPFQMQLLLTKLTQFLPAPTP